HGGQHRLPPIRLHGGDGNRFGGWLHLGALGNHLADLQHFDTAQHTHHDQKRQYRNDNAFGHNLSIPYSCAVRGGRLEGDLVLCHPFFCRYFSGRILTTRFLKSIKAAAALDNRPVEQVVKGTKNIQPQGGSTMYSRPIRQVSVYLVTAFALISIVACAPRTYMIVDYPVPA